MAWYRIKAQSGGGYHATDIHFIEITGREAHKERLEDAREDWLDSRDWGHNGVVVTTTSAKRPSREWLLKQMQRFHSQVEYATGQRERFDRLYKEVRTG